MRKLLLTFQNPAQMSPLAESLTPSRNVLPLLQDSQLRGLSLYPSPDNRGWVSWFCLPQSGSTLRTRSGAGPLALPRTKKQDGLWSPAAAVLEINAIPPCLFIRKPALGKMYGGVEVHP